MNVLDRRIKHIMDDIIDVAYKNEDPVMKKKFHQYKLSIIPTENESKSGDYAPATRQIRVYNPSYGTRHMAKCCIHELSHHIDCILHGTSGHQKPFYEIYKRLAYPLYTLLFAISQTALLLFHINYFRFCQLQLLLVNPLLPIF